MDVRTAPHRIARASVGSQWRLGAIGAGGGLAWAAAFRTYMAELAGPDSQIDWIGTFGAILLPGATIGALLGVAAARMRVNDMRGRRWFAASPLLFGVSPLIVPGAFETLVTTGMGTGGLWVALTAIAGGYALGAGGWLWLRIGCGALAALSAVGVVATLPMIGGPRLALTEPTGAWVAVLATACLALFAVAASVPFRGLAGARRRRTAEVLAPRGA